MSSWVGRMAVAVVVMVMVMVMVVFTGGVEGLDDSCGGYLSRVAWPSVYGNSGFTAFNPMREGGGGTLAACAWSAPFEADTQGVWAPTTTGGGNMAIGSAGRLFVGMEQPHTVLAPFPQAAVAAFNASTGDNLFTLPLPGHQANMAVLVADASMVVLVGAAANASCTNYKDRGFCATQVTVVDGTSGAITAQATLHSVPTLTTGTPAALALEGGVLYVVSQPLRAVVSVAVSRSAVFRMGSTSFASASMPCAPGHLAVPAWSAVSLPGHGIAFEVGAPACNNTRLAVVNITQGRVAYVTPLSQSVRTYSFSPATGSMVINWGTQVVAVDVLRGAVTRSWNVTPSWVAHDTMVDPCSGQVYIPMNWTSPAGVTALSPSLQPLWSYTLPSPWQPEDSFIQTIQSPAQSTAAQGTVTALSIETDDKLEPIAANLVVLSASGDVVTTRSIPVGKLQGAVVGASNMFRVIKTVSKPQGTMETVVTCSSLVSE